MAKVMNEKQWTAIAILATPGRGNMTYDEVAEKVGVSRMTIHRWRQDDKFNEEVKKQVLRNATEYLPDMYASIPKHVIEDGNAAMFRTFIQSLGMLTDKVEIDNKSEGGKEIDEMKAQLEAFRQRNKADEGNE